MMIIVDISYWIKNKKQKQKQKQKQKKIQFKY